jgi:hypothetical protein
LLTFVGAAKKSECRPAQGSKKIKIKANIEPAVANAAGKPPPAPAPSLLNMSPTKDHPPRHFEPYNTHIKPNVSENKHHHKTKQVQRMPPKQSSRNNRHQTQ